MRDAQNPELTTWLTAYDDEKSYPAWTNHPLAPHTPSLTLARSYSCKNGVHRRKDYTVIYHVFFVHILGVYVDT